MILPCQPPEVPSNLALGAFLVTLYVDVVDCISIGKLRAKLCAESEKLKKKLYY